ncbi:hypothetical protein EW146_g8479 [Bondarzewia mesenterica]|uniref:Uncharacterized protein n=1 Tax=Bondarzewia mesenterica TaxID=1095465 RepID=A0A4S4LE16_9AGAM|nr:hypothetical protein EW146_g8479 [Bondarzewia mesenterica]
MTEYDYSPEAYERYLATQHRISDWRDDVNRKAFIKASSGPIAAAAAAHKHSLSQGYVSAPPRPTPLRSHTTGQAIYPSASRHLHTTSQPHITSSRHRSHSKSSIPTPTPTSAKTFNYYVHPNPPAQPKRSRTYSYAAAPTPLPIPVPSPVSYPPPRGSAPQVAACECGLL